MNITEQSELLDLLNEYPWLKEELAQISEKFQMLNTPIGKVMVKKVTIGDMSQRSGVELNTLIQKPEELIARHE